MIGGERELHLLLVAVEAGLALLAAMALVFLVAPYGRHARPGFGPSLDNRVAWVLMESPAAFGFVAIYMAGEHRLAVASLALLGLWLLHYGQRTLVFPFRLRTTGKRMPALVVLWGFAFNVLNAYVNARWISELGAYTASWLWDPRFVLGATLFVGGWWINLSADTALIALRAPGETEYKLPQGGWFERISCPNYFGEILAWTGWAIATWSWAGASFALFTACNLAPRARANHRWYSRTFSDYPTKRRALIPWVW